MAASAVCRAVGAGTRGLLRTRSSVRRQREHKAVELGASARGGERTVGGGGWRLGRFRGQGRAKVTALSGDGSLATGRGAATGIPLLACEPRRDLATQPSVLVVPLCSRSC